MTLTETRIMNELPSFYNSLNDEGADWSQVETAELRLMVENPSYFGLSAHEYDSATDELEERQAAQDESVAEMAATGN